MNYLKKCTIILLSFIICMNILGTIVVQAIDNTILEENNEIEENRVENVVEENVTENVVQENENIVQDNLTKNEVSNEENIVNEQVENEENKEKEKEQEQDGMREIVQENVEDTPEIQENTPLIEGGYYQIITGVSSNKVLEVKGASDYNEANVQIYTNLKEKQQKFELKYLGNGEYEIINLKSGKLLDVANGWKENCTNVWQFERNGTDAQKWIIEDAGNGFYWIKSKCSGLYLDVADGLSKNETNVQIYEKNGTNAQKFKFVKTETVTGNKTIDNGYYIISSKVNTNKVLDVNGELISNETNIQIWTNKRERHQIFKITYNGSGSYTIQNVNSKKYLDVACGLTRNGTNVWQYDGNKTKAQNWIIKDEGNGFFSIISECNDLYLDVTGGISADGTNVQVYEGNGTDAQKFKLTSVDVAEGTKSISDGKYKISMYSDRSKVLDVNGGSTANGANVQIWSYNNGLGQKFKIAYIGQGYYKITNIKSGKLLDVSGASSADGTNVWQYENNETKAQKWIIEAAEGGGYNIISVLGNKYLTVVDGATADGTNVAIYEKNGTDSQKFYFDKVTTVNLETGTYGFSGLKIKGDARGKTLNYYKIGYGPNVFFATFAVHGWEDSWSYDGTELTKIAESFKEKLISMQDENLASKWTIYIFPSVNPDGEYFGTSHNGPGRCSLYSDISSHKGMDINRCFSTSWTKNTSSRNYNGTAPFQAFEARYLRDFLLGARAKNGQTVLVDLHGWLDETIGDAWIGSKYASAYGLDEHIATYGKGYLVNWARSNLGYNGRAARAALIELPMIYSPNGASQGNFAGKYINATLSVLREM